MIAAHDRFGVDISGPEDEVLRACRALGSHSELLAALVGLFNACCEVQRQLPVVTFADAMANAERAISKAQGEPAQC